MKFTQHIVALIIVFISGSASAQEFSEYNTSVIISQSRGTEPDSSAILKIESNTQGILIPRMTIAQRNAIHNPKAGLLVYVTSTGSFSFYDDSQWQNLLFIKSSIHDQDDDTSISVEEGFDNDQIVMHAADEEVLHLDTTTFQLFHNLDFIIANNVSGAGKKILWNHDNASFRAGEINGTQWNNSEIGRNSTAFGIDNEASGIGSMSWGESNIASRTNSTAWGDGTQSTAGRSTAWGSNSQASGNNATAWGASTIASDVFATAWGNGSTADALASTAWGNATEASGIASTSWGELTESSGLGSTAWGKNTLVSGSYASAWGNEARALGENATTWGHTSFADSTNATAWGNQTKAIGEQATAWGNQTLAEGENATAWGYFSRATNHYATAWGDASAATGVNSTAWGNEGQALGKDATAWNFGIATGEGSTAVNGAAAFGTFSTAVGSVAAKSYFEIALGHNGTDYIPADTSNWAAQDRLFSIGAGTPSSGKNAITILKNGNIGIVIDTPQHIFHIQDTNSIEVVLRSTHNNGILNIDGKDSTILTLQNNGIDNYNLISTPGEVIFNDASGNTTLSLEDNAVNINGNGGQDLTVFQSTDSTGITLANGANVWSLSSNPGVELILRQGADIRGMFDPSGMYFPLSDKRLKRNIQEVNNGLKTIHQLRPVTYLMKNSSSNKYTGFIAQEVHQVIPHMVKYTEEKDLYTMNYDGMTAINVKAIQELSIQVQSLQKQIEILESKLDEISKDD